MLKELVAGEELTKEVTRIHTEGVSVLEEAQLSWAELEDNLVRHFRCQRCLRQGNYALWWQPGWERPAPTRLGFTAQGPQSDLQDWIWKKEKKPKHPSTFTVVHLGINEHLWSDRRAHQLEREDISPSHSRQDTKWEVAMKKRNSILKYTKSGISARNYPKSLHNVTEESSEVPSKDICTIYITHILESLNANHQTSTMSFPAMANIPAIRSFLVTGTSPSPAFTSW